MKYFLTFVALISILSACQTNKEHFDTELAKVEITSVLEDQQNAWNEANIDKFMQSYWKSDSLTFVGANGLTKGWQNTLNNYIKRYPDVKAMGQLSFEIIKIDILSNTSAVMLGRYTLHRSTDQPTGLFTLVWKNMGGRWVIVSDHTC